MDIFNEGFQLVFFCYCGLFYYLELMFILYFLCYKFMAIINGTTSYNSF